MGRELKPIYICDNCGTTYYDRLQIRIFKNFVYDGEQISSFINKEEQEERMLCKRCTIIELDLDTQPSQKIIDEVVEKISTDKDFWKKLNSNELSDKIRHNEQIMNNIMSEKEFITEEPTVEDLEKIITDNSWTAEVESKVGDIVEHFDGNTYKITDVYTQTDKLPIEEQNLETEIKEEIQDRIVEEFVNIKDDIEVTYTPVEKTDQSIGEMKVYDDGKYLILFRIDTEEQELYLAKSCGYANLKELRECCGKPLTSIYISTDKYVSDLKVSELKEVQVINKIFMGIPNIINRVVILDPNNTGLAYISKEDFDLQIENLPIEPSPVIPEELLITDEPDFEEKDITAEFLDEESEYV